MKLYTEEQLERAIDLAKRNVSKNRIVESLTPIELPSDQEIYINANVNSANTEQHLGFIKGIQHMRELIQGGNKQECQFEIDNSTSSATKCKFCGKEKWQHQTTMSNNKQSSLDLLFDHMVGLCEDYDDGKINYTQYCNGVKEMYQKAKAMHKEEICQFAFDYYDEYCNNGIVPPIQDYYNEYFNTKEK